MSKTLYRNEEVYKSTTLTIPENISSNKFWWVGVNTKEIFCDAAIFVSIITLFVFIVYLDFTTR
uniref:Uncharacterized protein n=1 Tax=Cryptophlebia leucotreta granulosis virus TaxID=35254 RepID=A0A2H4ZKK4_GVCL|nr:hypothetical protein [Cryptophlebia leucotreta granulovirus]